MKALVASFCFFFMTFSNAESGESHDFALSKSEINGGKEKYPRYYEVVAKNLVISGCSLTTSCANLSLKNEGFIRIGFITYKLRWFKFFAQDVRYYLNEMFRHQ